ncbi:MAG: methylated-DNA--[protein]-cysteine S-methyltransferase [Muricoprocola sp.]
MIYTTYYNSPLGKIWLAADEEGLIGLWFEKQKYSADVCKGNIVDREVDILQETKQWLDIYFSGKEPDFTPHMHMIGSDFRKAVWNILLEIPYGHTITYGDIARRIAAERGIAKMSAQAVGGAVGHNPISVIIPCHRVVGTNGNLTGYGGGIDKKIQLLTLEKMDMSRFF